MIRSLLRRSFRLGQGIARVALREAREIRGRPDAGSTAPDPADVEPAGDFESARTVGVEELERALESGDSVLLDCRESHEWEAGYISPCVHIPMNDLPERVGELDASKTTVVYCLNGVRSAEVAAWLARERGFVDVASLDGGIVSWYSEYDQSRIVVVRPEDH